MTTSLTPSSLERLSRICPCDVQVVRADRGIGGYIGFHRHRQAAAEIQAQLYVDVAVD